jgi:hypothetical protein
VQGKSVKRINTKDELEKYKIEGKWNGYIIADNVDNIHEEGGYKFAYIGNEVVIDNESVRIRIAVKKKIGSNHYSNIPLPNNFFDKLNFVAIWILNKSNPSSFTI